MIHIQGTKRLYKYSDRHLRDGEGNPGLMRGQAPQAAIPAKLVMTLIWITNVRRGEEGKQEKLMPGSAH